MLTHLSPQVSDLMGELCDIIPLTFYNASVLPINNNLAHLGRLMY